MNYKERIDELEREIASFDYERLKRLEHAQQTQAKLQQELVEIDRATLTRQGEIIGLKRLIAEEEQQKEDDINTP